jgi:hypothetical protein
MRSPLKILGPHDEELGPIPNPIRMFDCQNYEVCLNLTAALNWESFTCGGCEGAINEALLQRASIALKNDQSLAPLIGNLTSKSK